MTPASANASSSWVRVVVPGGAVTSGKRASVLTAMVCDAFAPGGSTASRSCSPSAWLVRPASTHRLGGDPELARAARDQVDDRGGVGGVGERDVDAGVREPERAHQRRDGIDGERGERDEVETPGGEPGHRLDRGATGLDVAQHLARRLDQRLAGRGEHHPAPDPVEQRRPELGLELADGLRHRGLRHVLGFGRPGHAALVDHGEEEAEPSEIHRQILCSSQELRLGLLGCTGRTMEACTSLPVVLAGVGIGLAFGLFGAGGSAFGTPVLALLGIPAPIALGVAAPRRAARGDARRAAVPPGRACSTARVARARGAGRGARP